MAEGDAMADARAPEGPWHELDPVDPAVGYGSLYLSDPLARVPVREVTRLGDNKSDPNLETGTYGLFSTCQLSTRIGVVQRRAAYLVFVTTWPPAGGRAIAGYYRIGWWTEGSLHPAQKDYSLAADHARWVDPVPVRALPSPLNDPSLWTFRGGKKFDAAQTAAIVAHLDSLPDRSDLYRREVDRLERWNLHNTGYRYVNWRRGQPFTWADAPSYLTKADLPDPSESNRSKSGRWRCVECADEFASGALLKVCPNCSSVGTLQQAKE